MWRRGKEALVRGGLNVIEADSITVDQPAISLAEKIELHRQYPVGTVNMEDYWAARLAGHAKVPFLSVRAVLDTAHQSLPSYLLELPRRRGPAIMATLLQPWRAPVMWRLAKQMHLAQESLAHFTLAFLDSQDNAVPADPAETV
jgi:hypothetical protein